MASAKNVILYTTLTNKRRDKDDTKNGISGLLVVTNFKLSFLTANNDQVRGYWLPLLFSSKLIDFQWISAEYYVPRESIPQLQRCHPAKYRLHIPNCRWKAAGVESIEKNQIEIGRFANCLQSKFNSLLFAFKFSSASRDVSCWISLRRISEC